MQETEDEDAGVQYEELTTRPSSSHQKRSEESTVSSSTHVTGTVLEQGCDLDKPVVLH